MNNDDQHTDEHYSDSLTEQLRNLPRNIQPERDLWVGIDHHINADQFMERRHPVKAYAFAASLLLLLGLGVFMFDAEPPGESLAPDLSTLVQSLQQDHSRNVEALLVQYQNQQASYPDWEMQMQQLQEAEQAIYAALQNDPANLELLKILRQVQAKQIDLIDSVFAPFLTII